jgi:hypothetical protein
MLLLRKSYLSRKVVPECHSRDACPRVGGEGGSRHIGLRERAGVVVIPVEAGIQVYKYLMDPCLRGGDVSTHSLV